MVKKIRCLIVEFLSAGGAECSRYGCKMPDPELKNEGALLARSFSASLSDSDRYAVTLLVNSSGDPVKKRNIEPVATYNLEIVQVKRSLFYETLLEQAVNASQIVLIAPEIDGVAIQCCRDLTSHSSKLISPGIEFTRIASDKKLTNAVLQSAGVPIPQAVATSKPAWFVIKPRMGAGGDGIQVMAANQIGEFVRDNAMQNNAMQNSPCVVEPWIDGIPVSVSVIRGPLQTCVLPATEQLINRCSKDIRDFDPGCDVPKNVGSYCGSRFPMGDIEPQCLKLAMRAESLARKTVKAMPDFIGYVGIDMILASKPEFDCVVDINPRLTSSFVLLSRMCKNNLAEALVDICLGRKTSLQFDLTPCEFSLPDENSVLLEEKN